LEQLDGMQCLTRKEQHELQRMDNLD